MAVETERDVLDSGRAGGIAIRGGALRTGGYLLAMLFSLASVPFMTRHLGPVDYGYYATVTSILFIITGVTEAGLTNLGTREYVVLRGAERDHFLRNLVGLRLALTAGGVLGAVLFTAVTGAHKSVVQGTLIMGVGSLLAFTQATYAVPLSAQLRLGWVAGLELLKQATISLTIIVLVIVGASLVPFFFASVVAGVVMLGCTLLLLRGETALVPSFDMARWRGVLADVLPYALAAAVGLFYFRLALVLMSYIGSAEETGIYGAAFRIVETIAVVPWLVVSSGFPILARAARDDTDRLRYALGRLFDVSLLIGVWISLSVAIGAYVAVEIVAGSSFSGATEVLRIQALSLITAFLVATWSFALLSLKRFSELLIANAVAAATAAALTVALVPSLGAKGAAIATLAAEAVLAAGYLVALARRDRHLLPSPGQVPRLVPGTAAMVVIGVALPDHPVVAVILAGIAYWLLAFAFRAVPDELINAVRRRDPPSA